VRLASTVVCLRALAKNHGNSELAPPQFGRIRKRNRPVPRGAPASAAGRCRWTSSAPSRRLPPQRPVRLLRDGFRLLLRRIISTPSASRSAGTSSASASRRKAGTPGKPQSLSQWPKVLAGQRARRASSARDRPASPPNVRRCPPKLIGRSRRPAPLTRGHGARNCGPSFLGLPMKRHTGTASIASAGTAALRPGPTSPWPSS
jgi:hypothetical protein